MSFTRQQIEIAKLPQVVRHKWGDALLVEGFVPVPKRLIRVLARVFGRPEFELLQAVLAVADFDRPNLMQNPSAEFLAYLAGLSEVKFMGRLGELEAMGLIDRSGSTESINVVMGKLKYAANSLATKDDVEEHQ